MMSEELKPCPFCGGTPTLDDCRTIFAVRCDCGVCMLGERAPEPDNEMTNEYWYHFKMTAIDAWNQREAVSADELAALKAGQGDAVAWQFLDHDGKWYTGSDLNNHRRNTEEAGYQIRELFAKGENP